MNVRALPRIVAPAALLAVVTLAACVPSSDDGGSTATDAAPTSSFAPTTSLIPDCSGMPPTADVSAIAGVPLGDGVVTGAGLCQFTGVNDQSLAVLLQRLTDPGDRSSFLDLQSSLGDPERVRRSDLPDALAGPDGTVWVDRDGVIFSAWVSVTGGPASAQTGVAADLLAVWLDV